MQIINLFMCSEKKTTTKKVSRSESPTDVCEHGIICSLVFHECRAGHLGLIKIPLSKATQVQVLCNLGLFHFIFFYFKGLF